MRHKKTQNSKKWLFLLITFILAPIFTLKAQDDIQQETQEVQEDISAFAKKQEFIKDLNIDEYSYWFEYLKSLDNKNLKEYASLYKTMKYKFPKNKLKQFIEASEQNPDNTNPFFIVIAKNAYFHSKSKQKEAKDKKQIDENQINKKESSLLEYDKKHFDPNAGFSFHKNLSSEFGNDKDDTNSLSMSYNQENNIEEYRDSIKEEEIKTAITYIGGGIALIIVIIIFIKIWNKEQ